MKVLHVGCGRQPINEAFAGWEEVRMDIDPSCRPDIVASLTDMGDIGEFDAVFGSHVLEHFAPHEVARVLGECRRVLKDGGYCLMIVPNLSNVRPTREPLYDSPAGQITGLDMFYGKESMVADNPYMAHKTGFVAETLQEAMSEFRVARTYELTDYNLMGIGVK